MFQFNEGELNFSYSRNHIFNPEGWFHNNRIFGSHVFLKHRIEQTIFPNLRIEPKKVDTYEDYGATRKSRQGR